MRRWRVTFHDENGLIHVHDFWTQRGAKKYMVSYENYKARQYIHGNLLSPTLYATIKYFDGRNYYQILGLGGPTRLTDILRRKSLGLDNGA